VFLNVTIIILMSRNEKTAPETTIRRYFKRRLLLALKPMVIYAWLPILLFAAYSNLDSFVGLINNRFTVASSQSLISNIDYILKFSKDVFSPKVHKANCALSYFVGLYAQKALIMIWLTIEFIFILVMFCLQIESVYKTISSSLIRLMATSEINFGTFARFVLDNFFNRCIFLYFMSIPSLFLITSISIEGSKDEVSFSSRLWQGNLEAQIFLIYLIGIFGRFSLFMLVAIAFLRMKISKFPFDDYNEDEEFKVFENFILVDYESLVLNKHTISNHFRVVKPEFDMELTEEKDLIVHFNISKSTIMYRGMNEDILLDTESIIKIVSEQYYEILVDIASLKNPLSRTGFPFLAIGSFINVSTGVFFWFFLIIFHKSILFKVLLVVSILVASFVTILTTVIRMLSVRSMNVEQKRIKNPKLSLPKLEIILKDKNLGNPQQLMSTERKSLVKDNFYEEYFANLEDQEAINIKRRKDNSIIFIH
jgi:hypothetical protein